MLRPNNTLHILHIIVLAIVERLTIDLKHLNHSCIELTILTEILHKLSINIC